MRRSNRRGRKSTKTRRAKSAGERFDCFEFGARLLATNDLDPVYVCLHEADCFHGSKEARDLLQRWLIAYWCFYDMGTASLFASKKSFWTYMTLGASSKHYKRGTERRHFRGANAKKSVAYLREIGVRGLFAPLLRCKTQDDVMRSVGAWVGFGPWIGFKVADMLETLDIAPIAFSVEGVFLFDSPRDGAVRLREELLGGESGLSDEETPAWAVETVLAKLSKKFRYAPPRYERPLGVQEAETVLCKWKSHLNGHYEIGHDIKHCKLALERYYKNEIADALLRAGSKGGLW